MLIAAFDLARVTGWAIGPAGSIPSSGSWILRRPSEDIHIEPGALVKRMMDLFEKHGRPDLIALEKYMSPSADRKRGTMKIVPQLMAHGAVQAFASISRINVCHWPVQTIRKHVCGHGRDADGENKQMVLRTMKMLGLLPKDCIDADRADALAVWRYAEDMVANVRGPLALVS